MFASRDGKRNVSVLKTPFSADDPWLERLEQTEIWDMMMENMRPNAETMLAVPGRHISGGVNHTVLLTDKGKVLTCGSGEFGKLGHGDDTSNQLAPKVVASLVRDNLQIVQVAAGWNHTLLLTTKGEVFTCGKGNSGPLGHADPENQLVPKMVEGLRLLSPDFVAGGAAAGKAPP